MWRKGKKSCEMNEWVNDSRCKKKRDKWDDRTNWDFERGKILYLSTEWRLCSNFMKLINLYYGLGLWLGGKRIVTLFAILPSLWWKEKYGLKTKHSDSDSALCLTFQRPVFCFNFADQNLVPESENKVEEKVHERVGTCSSAVLLSNGTCQPETHGFGWQALVISQWTVCSAHSSQFTI